MIDIKLGTYRHYRGGLYEVVGVGRIEATLEEVVIYKSLYDSDFPKDSIWVRPIKEFFEVIEKDGKTLSRFTPL